ncbi:hypothetical protein CNMCM5793_007086 [Aspergillus hiratsukae]|uniref:Transposase Tc1-like domain-containing protein n=1 Tax=Aspergillus hiratsukae TaxID=1194566 RepID=A0A8H6PNX2_9EURO|nr:hypothetical protein CNMCM5793_007086 [Aspergillus hiratsukae]KAF7157414.1 hypothetical protein CNMCM6106_002997 [Aspergillus hiratsukae]
MSSAKRVSKPPSSTSHRTMQRRPLKDLIDSNRARAGELTPYELGIIHGFNFGGLGLGSREISDELEIPESTVQRILEETPRDRGGPVRLSSRDERTILSALCADPSISYKEIRRKVGVDASDYTIRQCLKKLGYGDRSRKKRPQVTKEAVKPSTRPGQADVVQ